MSSNENNTHNTFLDIKTVTWSKDSHQLFDYESSQVGIEKKVIEQDCLIFRKDTIVIEYDQNSNSFQFQVNQKKKIWNKSKFSYQKLKKIYKEIILSLIQTILINKIIILQFDLQKTPLDHNKQFLEPQGYEIQPGDIIKLGRIEFRLVECKYQNEVRSVQQNKSSRSKELTNFGQKNQICRICLSDQQCPDSDQILINVCLCKGSCEYMHLGCLKQWMASKIQRKINGCTMYFKTKYLECELCKHPFPLNVIINNKQYDIIEIEKPTTSPYFIMETLSKDNDLPQGLYVVHILSEEPIKLVTFLNQGRGHASDIRISDISVSRLHAFISYNDGKYVLTDNNSKFGTLVLLQKQFQIKKQKMAIQVGRTVITFELKNADQIHGKTSDTLANRNYQTKNENGKK